MQLFQPCRRALLSAIVGATVGLSLGAGAQEAWPSKPIRLVVPFTPGGVTDTSGRLIAEHLSKRLGQQVVIDNKPGASGNIGTNLVAQSAPDGYTLVLGFDGTMVINPHVFAKVPFDTLKDFAPVGKIGDAVLILVSNPGVPAKSLQDVIALSKSTSGGLSYGTSGTGGTPHIAGELLAQRTGAQLTHVPYKGGGQAMTDVLGGSIPLVYTAVAGAHGHVKSGKLRAIAVSSAQRTPALPEVPGMSEAGLADFSVNNYFGLVAPRGTPQAVIERINEALPRMLALPDVQARFRADALDPATLGPQAQARFIAQDYAGWQKVATAQQIKLDSV